MYGIMASKALKCRANSRPYKSYFIVEIVLV